MDSQEKKNMRQSMSPEPFYGFGDEMCLCEGSNLALTVFNAKEEPGMLEKSPEPSSPGKEDNPKKKDKSPEPSSPGKEDNPKKKETAQVGPVSNNSKTSNEVGLEPIVKNLDLLQSIKLNQRLKFFHPGITRRILMFKNNGFMTGFLFFKKGATLTSSTTHTTYIVLKGAAIVRIMDLSKRIKSSEPGASFFIPAYADFMIGNNEDNELKLLFTKFNSSTKIELLNHLSI